MAHLYLLEPLDRFFFRGSKPFNAGETQWIVSEFPPSPRVVQGVLRSAIGEHLEVNWEEFNGGLGNGCKHRLGETLNLVEQIGSADCLGKLQLSGPFLHFNDELLFPVPLDLYRGKNGFGLLQPGVAATPCDLCKVRLPTASEAGIKVMEGRFVTFDLMQMLLTGDVSKVREIVRESGAVNGDLWPLYPPEDKPKAPALADLEPKIGLKRDNTTRRHAEGMLYGIAFARPRDGVRLAVHVTGNGLDERLHPDQARVIRFGGEGKLTRIDAQLLQQPPWPEMPNLQVDRRIRFRMVLTTPALMPKMPKDRWLPENFIEDTGSPKTWSGNIDGLKCTIISACIGKAVRIGGWNLVGNSPKPLQSLVPAGSVYFCEADVSEKENIKKLHGGHIGGDTEYGFGHVLVGTWKGEN